MKKFSKVPGVEIAAVCEIDENVLGTRLGDIQAGFAQTANVHGRAQGPGRQVHRRYHSCHSEPLAFADGCLGVPRRQKTHTSKAALTQLVGGKQLVAAVNRTGSYTGNAEPVKFCSPGGGTKHAQWTSGRSLYGAWACYKWRDTIGRQPRQPVPAGVHYDLWLGPAPDRGFTLNRFHYNWHWFWGTGNGDLGNKGIHEMNIARWGWE